MADTPTPSISESRTKCSKTDNLVVGCSKCKSAWYCVTLLSLHPHLDESKTQSIISLERKSYVLRKDRKPLSKEVVEMMYEYHENILNEVYGDWYGDAPYEITPKTSQEFSDKYWREKALKDGADGCG